MARRRTPLRRLGLTAPDEGSDGTGVELIMRGADEQLLLKALIVVPVFASSHVKEGRLLASTAQSEYLVNIAFGRRTA